MPGFSLHEEMVEVVNVCPPTLAGEVTKRAEIMRREVNPKSYEFAVNWQWSAGAEAQRVCIEPGGSLKLPLAIAMDCEQACRVFGVVLLRANDDLRSKIIEGLQNAAEFYHMRGAQELLSLKSRHSWTETEMAQMRQQFAGQWVNRVREEIIRAELARVESDAETLPED